MNREQMLIVAAFLAAQLVKRGSIKEPETREEKLMLIAACLADFKKFLGAIKVQVSPDAKAVNAVASSGLN